jgi:hypothetical protein
MTQSLFQNPATARVNVVVPVYNKRPLLEPAIGSILAAAEKHGATDIRLVDNGSTDGSFELLESFFADRASILRLTQGSIGAVRNFGARLGTAGIISFLDCDCLVPLDFFTVLEEVFERTGAAAAGRRIVLPPNPSWVESTWDQMHQDGLDGERTWINSANLAVRRRVFESLGGFDETLETGEDAELCQRIRGSGGTIMQDQRLAVAHLDNSKTLPAFYRKERWRGLGMFGTVSTSALDKPTAITLLHFLLLCIAAATHCSDPASVGSRRDRRVQKAIFDSSIQRVPCSGSLRAVPAREDQRNVHRARAARSRFCRRQPGQARNSLIALSGERMSPATKP